MDEINKEIHIKLLHKTQWMEVVGAHVVDALGPANNGGQNGPLATCQPIQKNNKAVCQ